jgi:hypothetical protein
MAPKKRTRNRITRREERRLTVRGIRRDPPDIRKLGKALLYLAMAEAERQAQAEQSIRDGQPEAPSGDEEQTRR